jgi:hypothetical protein
VKSAKSGPGKILFRYALGSDARPLKLIVNGEEHSILPFPETGGWSRWKDLTASVAFRKGDNLVVLETNGASGGNIDHLQVIEPKR